MNQLFEYYRKRIRELTAMIFLLALLVPNYLVPYLGSKYGVEHWITIAANFLSSSAMIAVFFVVGDLVIRKWIWKLEKPQFNFDGEWEGTTTYKRVHVGSAKVPFEIKHHVKFEQDCSRFAIAPQTGVGYVNWGSLAINLADKDTVQYAYWVKYNDQKRFPEKAIGYEEMKVIERDSKGRPQVLSGDFYHCAQGSEPVYSGNVIFRRVQS